MTYYMLTDKTNCGEIVKFDGESYFTYSFGTERWDESAIMTWYDWPDDPLYGQYITINEQEAFAKIDSQRILLNKLFLLAKEIATKAHEGQLDKGGNPYIAHPLAVANELENLEYKIVAVLHDVLEDSPVTEEDLLRAGFTKRIVHSVMLLTKQDSADYDEYLKRIRRDSNAKNVKIADLQHNLQVDRIANPTQKDYDRIDKYKRALAFLTS